MISEVVIGGATGLVFGSSVAYLNYRITKYFSKGYRDTGVIGGRISDMKIISSRMLVNISALTATFVFHDILQVSFVALIVGTATGLSVVSILLLWYLSKSFE